MANTRKPVIADFSNVGGGLNNSDDMLLIKSSQVQQCLDAKLFKDGVFRAPGTEAGDAVLSTNGRGIHIYRKLDGTEIVLVLSNGRLYNSPSNLDSLTELYNIGGTGFGSFANYLDKCFVCNGTGVVKVEGTNCFQVGIDPPSGVVAVASSGGTLPDGTYTVYACYSRYVSGQSVLYSVGENVGSVVLGSGNNTIAVSSFANSSDAQVGNKAIFLTEPVSGVTYLYHNTGNNTTTSFNITSDANKNALQIYQTVAAENTVPDPFEYIIAFNSSIYGSSGNVLYQSIKSTTNTNDLERFAKSLVLPFDIKGMFGLGEHLYINTTGGIILLKYGDINSEWDLLTKEYFYEINTVGEISERRIIGLTHTGIRFFNGEQFFGHDISRDIKTEIAKIYNTTTAFKPFGVIVRSSDRLEYHLGYNDRTVTEATNNVRLVLNLDEVQLLPNYDVVAPWEMWSIGFNFACTDLTQNLYMLQDHATTPILYKHITTKTTDIGVYGNDGALISTETPKTLRVTYRAYIVDAMTMARWYLVAMIAKAISAIKITMRIREGGNPDTNVVSITPGSEEKLWAPAPNPSDEMVWDEDNWGTESFVMKTARTKDNMKGFIMYIEIEQTENDIDFHILKLESHGKWERHRYIEGA
ncbi:MAG TPA: hypothetical protein VMY59_09930 [Candidatus Thermoplasmatota archaeon]|nr:hypothetical protein [Candidatus Thermoplasmatota archaeon]